MSPSSLLSSVGGRDRGGTGLDLVKGVEVGVLNRGTDVLGGGGSPGRHGDGWLDYILLA